MAVTPFTSVVRRLEFQLRAELVNATANAIAAAGAGAGQVAIAFADALRSEADSRRRMITAHQRIAGKMQDAVEGAYDTMVEARKSVPSYREGQNRLPHTLRPAVTDPRNFQGTRDGIGFINEPFLDATAAHWRRMNFGSAEAASEAPGRYPVTFNGTVSFMVGLEPSPGAPVLMPEGYFVAGAFYPTSGPGTAIRPTRGIQARHFFDPGIETLARELPVEYEAMYRDWFDLAAREARGALAKIGRTAPGPGFF